MRSHMAETRRDGVRVVLTVIIVAAVAVATVGLLEIRPTVGGRVESAKTGRYSGGLSRRRSQPMHLFGKFGP